ncbi:DUF1592 domain-containing protein [Pelagicoccus mobilis]|uniref:DUF1592 domain-containing protein n=1 Tax=Pelagicoccus mobilis TaxID=415221 RepID=A0A934VP93_9BACT|nr:DUF1592 domain-containing protein [Pelagicoccus mobilis]MBK1875299.1 DUF1592 domain-containing protein [Pelagicoccus mobilis]
MLSWSNSFRVGSIGLVLLGGGSAYSSIGDYEHSVAPFIEEHCVKCHGEEKQKGDVRLDDLAWDFNDGSNAVAWQDISDMLIIGDMPPEEEERPPEGEISKVVELIDTQLRRAAEAQQGGGRIEIRRLSHSALDNTVRDLLGIEQLLSENLPADAEFEGFENLAMTLDANPELVLKLQDNVRRLAAIALSSGEDPRQNLIFEADDLGHGRSVELRDGFVNTASGRDRNAAIWPCGYVVPEDGLYRVRIRTFAGDNRWELEEKGIEYRYTKQDYNESMAKQKRRSPDDTRLAAIVAIQAEEARPQDSGTLPGRRVGYFYSEKDVAWDTVDVRLKKGENIMIQYASAANLQAPPYAIVEGKRMLVAEILHVGELQIEGPLMESWPTKAYAGLLNSDVDLGGRVSGFLEEAFRRPVLESTVSIYTELFLNGVEQGLSDEEAMRNLLEAVLCSPRFLFNYDRGDGEDAWGLANRLSYFLWNSAPDNELREAAGAGSLLSPEEVGRQAERMLKDPRLERFVHDFTAQWLGLKDIELMRPDPKLYRNYEPLLEGLMAEESREFFLHVLQENLPLTAFLDSDFVVINERLAKHYDIPDVVGDYFREVGISEDSPRGGLLGQASILKLTSNGTRTSPVVRGVWVLENVLGAPPSPPPADVPPIEPDVRGTTTIREMLAKHREVETCNSCHRKIDPWGFGLEQFDAVGAFRSEYRNGQDVYSKGTVSNGFFDGVTEMKSILLERSQQFYRALTEKLFTHALGHPLSFDERIVADDIADRNLAEGLGFRDLILDICRSHLFMNTGKSKDESRILHSSID